MKKSRPLTIEECCGILEACYLANDRPHPMGLGLRQSIVYLKLLQDKGFPALIINCDDCGEQLDELGALLFSPPRTGSETTKFHLCKKCFKKIKKIIHL